MAIEVTDDAMNGHTGIVGGNIGCGIRKPGRGWDARLGYDSMLSSGNIQGFLGLHCGWRF